MDKFALNTEIVSMRHDIRRARVHTINKLVRTSRKLKNKRGSEKEKEKDQRKAARFMEEITIIKSLKDDEISKFALTNIKALDDILKDPKISLREKALARLSGHPNIITRVRQFRTKFPSWEDSLPKLLEQLGGKKKKKNTKTKPQLKITPSSSKVMNENIDNSSADISDVEEKQNISSSNPEVDTTKLSKPTTVKTSRKRKELKISDSDVKNSKMKGLEKSLVEVKRFSEILKSIDGDDDSNHNEEDIAYSDSISNNNNNKTLNNVPEEKSVDPFFLCEDGETEYLTNVKKISDESGLGEKSKKIVEQSWKRDSRSVFGQREKRHGQILEPKNFNIKSSRRDDLRFGNKSKKSQGQKFNRADVRKEIQNGVNEPLHPSWQAKKRLQEQQHAISAFQGKKIKFED